MDPNGHIYMDDDSKIPAEDKARLDGYLRGRAESDALSGYSGPGRYRHYKGGEYEVLGLALQEDKVQKPDQPTWSAGECGDHMDLCTEVQFVIYRPLTAGSLLESRAEDFWARRLDDFNAMVEREHGMVSRFVREA